MGDVGGGEGIGEVGKCAWPIRVCFSATQTAVIAAEPFIWCPPARPPARRGHLGSRVWTLSGNYFIPLRSP